MKPDVSLFVRRAGIFLCSFIFFISLRLFNELPDSLPNNPRKRNVPGKRNFCQRIIILFFQTDGKACGLQGAVSHRILRHFAKRNHSSNELQQSDAEFTV